MGETKNKKTIFAVETREFTVMKKFVIILLITLLFGAASANAQTKRLNPYITTTTYNLPGETP